MQTKGTETLAPPPSQQFTDCPGRQVASGFLFAQIFRLEWLHSKNISDALRDQRQSFWKFPAFFFFATTLKVASRRREAAEVEAAP